MIKKKIISLALLLLLIIAGIAFLMWGAEIASAADISIIDPNDPGYAQGDYSLNDIIYTFIKVSKIIFGLSGSLALLMFVYGGFKYLISAGDSGKVKEATGVITAAVVGLALIFGAFMIIQFTLASLGVVDDGGAFKMFSGTWFSLP